LGWWQFRALSDQLYRSPEHHKFVRKSVVTQLKAAPDAYSNYVPMKYTDYVKNMAKDGEWGDHVTLQAAADYVTSYSLYGDLLQISFNWLPSGLSVIISMLCFPLDLFTRWQSSSYFTSDHLLFSTIKNHCEILMCSLTSSVSFL
jgi:hypothetical protein